MEDSADRNPGEDRIARATERLRAARERASQAHEQLIVARERLVQARRALRASQTEEAPGQESHADPTEPSGDSP